MVDDHAFASDALIERNASEGVASQIGDRAVIGQVQTHAARTAAGGDGQRIHSERGRRHRGDRRTAKTARHQREITSVDTNYRFAEGYHRGHRAGVRRTRDHGGDRHHGRRQGVDGDSSTGHCRAEITGSIDRAHAGINGLTVSANLAQRQSASGAAEQITRPRRRADLNEIMIYACRANIDTCWPSKSDRRVSGQNAATT